MRKRTLRSLALIICLALIATSLSSAQGRLRQKAETTDPAMLRALEEAAMAIQASFDRNGLEEVLRLPSIMKESGLVYDPALLATSDNRVVKGKDEMQLRTLRGIYAMDVLYTLAFDKSLDPVLMTMVNVEESLGCVVYP